jgi:hypothetical protein
MRFQVFFTILLSTQIALSAGFEDFKKSSTTILESLRSQGMSQAGNLDLEKVIEKTHATKWQPFQQGFFGGSGKHRTTAIYLVEENTILVSEMALKILSPDVYPLAALHEALGAQGYADENYELTLSLDQLSKVTPNQRALFERRLKNLTPTVNHNKVYKHQDGGTSVGGGGDGFGIELKSIVLSEALRQNFSEDTLDIIFATELEINWDSQAPQVTASKKADSWLIEISGFYWFMLNAAKNTDQKNAVAQQVLSILMEKR